MLVSDFCNFLEVGDIVLRIANAFEIDASRVLVDEVVNFFGMIRIEETNLDAHILEGLGEERPGSAVKTRRRDEVLAHVTDRLKGRCDRRLSRGEGESGRAAVHRSQALFENIVRRVHQPAIDVAELGEAEEIGGMFRAVENIRGRRVDRDGTRVRGRVGHLTRVDSKGSEAVIRFVTHRFDLLRLSRVGRRLSPV